MKLTCHTDLIIANRPAAFSGKSYQILQDHKETVLIENEQLELHSFSKDPSSPAYYGNWFVIEGGNA